METSEKKKPGRPKASQRTGPLVLETEQKLKHDTPEFETAMEAFRERMKHYRHERVYPTLPDWPVVCFYNMTKRRGEQRNWYSLPFEERRTLMGGHARVGRQYAGKVKQLITGSTGLDDAEWAVTLFAHDTPPAVADKGLVAAHHAGIAHDFFARRRPLAPGDGGVPPESPRTHAADHPYPQLARLTTIGRGPGWSAASLSRARA